MSLGLKAASGLVLLAVITLAGKNYFGRPPKPIEVTEPRILKVRVDLNGDGRNELLVSDMQDAGQAGLIWQAYLNNGHDRYATTTDDLILSFNPAAVGYGKFPGDSTPSLVAYWPSSATEGSLMSYRVVDDKITEKHVTIEPLGKDHLIYSQLIHNLYSDENSPISLER